MRGKFGADGMLSLLMTYEFLVGMQLFSALSECMQGIEKAQGLIDKEAAAEASRKTSHLNQRW